MPEQKTIKFTPTVAQYKCLEYLQDDSTSEILFGGSGGCGKSYLGCAWMIINCLRYPGSRWLIGRSKLASLKKTTLRTFFTVARDFGLRADIDYNYNASSNIINFKCGSEIFLKDLFLYPSDPDFDSLGSLEIAGAFIDEASQISNKARQVVKSRIGWKMQDGTEIKPKLLYTCNPSKNWTYQDFYVPSTKGLLPVELKFIPALPQSNIYLSKGRQASLEALTGSDRKRLLLGQWEVDNDPASLIEYQNIMALFTNSHIIVENAAKETPLTRNNKDNLILTRLTDGTVIKDKYITADIARLGTDSTVIMIWYGNQIIEHHEYTQRTTDYTAGFIRDLQKTHNIPAHQVIIDADGIGGGVVDQIPGSVSFVNNSRPLNNENFNHLKSQCYFKLAQMINKNEIYFPVSDTSTKERIIQELEQVKRKDVDNDGKQAVTSKESVKDVLGHSPDFSDCMMLRMLPYVRHKTMSFADTYMFDVV